PPRARRVRSVDPAPILGVDPHVRAWRRLRLIALDRQTERLLEGLLAPPALDLHAVAAPDGPPPEEEEDRARRHEHRVRRNGAHPQRRLSQPRAPRLIELRRTDAGRESQRASER